MTDLLIVIVNWNARELLTQCLQSVYDTVSELNLNQEVV